MSTTEYKISIKGADLSFEQTVPFDLAKQLVALAASGGAVGSFNGQVGTGGPVAKQHQSPASADDAPALAEYISLHAAKRNIEQITAIGEYLRGNRGKATFTQSDLETGFEEAGESVPGNLARDITWAKKAGWIAPKGNADGHFYVTASGRAAIADNFSPETKAKSKVSAGGRKKKKQVAGKPA